MSGTILLTGATGFVGSEVLARLLEESDERVVALVRAPDAAAAQARLDATLGGLVENPAGVAHRVRAVRGELTAPRLGLSREDRAQLLGEVDAVIHCAASISFSDPLEEARAINVGGTREVLELAAEIAGRRGLRRLVHVSTAYVSGRHAGVFAEDDGWIGQEFRNTYEQTKLEAESLVREAAAALPGTIVRPSVVVGDSATGWTPAFNVLYWPLQAFARGLLRTLPALPDGRVDVVPVDFVARATLRALEAEGVRSGEVLTLAAGDGAPTVDELIGLAASALGRPRPPYAPLGGSGIAVASEQAELYAPYFDCEVVFDTSRARSVLEPAGIRPPAVGDYFPGLIDFAVRARWGKTPITRVQSRAGLAAAA